MAEIKIANKVLSKNDSEALINRELYDSHGLWCVNLISSPGAGKTTLVEKTADHFAGKLKIGVLVGDLETENDAERIRKHGVRVIQIITGGACHLTAVTIRERAEELGVEDLDALIIENVGNLVCPTSYHLGEHDRVCLISTPEGDDKPLKYPSAISKSDLVLISKTDLAPYTDFDIERAADNAGRIKASMPVINISSKSGEGLDGWFEWFEARCREHRKG